MPTPLGSPLPPYDPSTTKPNSTINTYDAIHAPPMLPTWDPTAEEQKADVKLAVVHPAERGCAPDGTCFGSQDGAHPRHTDATGAALTSDALHLGTGEKGVGPTQRMRDGGEKRK
jgi:hypothetical protein